MNKINLASLTLVAFLGLTTTAKAQLFDGFTQKKGDLSLTASFTYSNFDEFYLGTEKQDAVPAHDEITQNVYSLYAKYGISDNVSAYINLPYISTEGELGADPVNGETSISDFQDLSLAIKVNAYKFDLKAADLNIVTGLGLNLPLGYEPNGILSIGSGAWGVDYTAGLHLNTDVGFFSTLLATYALRADAEGVTGPEGNGPITSFQVPNSFSLLGKVGFASDFLYGELWARYANSDEGVDIGGTEFTGNFPETDVEYDAIGITLYKNITSQFGVSLGASTIFEGRNVGAGTTFSGGLTYNLTK